MNFDNEVVRQVKGDIDYITFKRLDEFQNLRHAFTIDKRVSFRTDKFNSTRILEDKEYKTSLDNYKKLCKLLDVPYNGLVKVNQEHTGNVVIVDKVGLNVLEYQNVDGMITNKKGVVLTTVSADCIIFFMYDKENQVIANVHSGWRGSLDGIGIKTLRLMKDNFNSKMEDIIICFNPSILGDCFLVKEDVRNLFYNKYKYLDSIDKIIKVHGDRWLIDTVLLNKTLFLEMGIKEKNIYLSNICTKCNNNVMHSYRGSKGAGGLNTALIVLR